MSAQGISRAAATLLMAVGRGPQERTLKELFDAFDVPPDDYFLTRLTNLARILRRCEVEVKPRLQDTPLDGKFLLRGENARISTEADIHDRLSQHESASLEFKSTYWYDLKRSQHHREATTSELRSDTIKHSALKSVAGFLATGGGTLYIGISDARKVLGLGSDLELLQGRRRSIDQLINNIKTDIADKFRDGNTVNDYVRIVAVDYEDVQILELEVASRSALSFLESSEGEYQLFRRQDNRTTTVEIYALEEFQTWRRKHILSVEL